MKPSWYVLVCTTLCLSAALGQDGANTQDGEVLRLRRRVVELEERVASLERLVIRLAAPAKASQPTAPKASAAPKPAEPDSPPAKSDKPQAPKPKAPLGVHD